MGAPMQQAVQRKAEPIVDSMVELPAHSSLPRLDLGVEWGSPWDEFVSSIRAYFTGPRPPKEEEAAADAVLRVEWVRGKFSPGAFAASSLWHVAIVLIMMLPIWGFLPSMKPNLAPVRIELTWYPPSHDLPPIELPGHAAQPSPRGDPAKPLPQKGADAYHPRQTILSMPVRVTHPRQTLIQPNAPDAPPKIVPQLPNVVEWAATAPKPQLHISPTAAAPVVKHRAAEDVAAPEIPNAEKTPGPMNVASMQVTNPQPKMPMIPMTSAAPERRQAHAEAAATPEMGPAASDGDASGHRLIALSASPAPPAPEVSVPQGNLSARVAISPDGSRPGIPGGATQDPRGNGGVGGDSSSMGGTNGGSGAGRGDGGGGAGSLPAGISISGGANTRPGTGGVGPSGNHPPTKLRLYTTPSLGAGPAPSVRRGPADVSHFDPSLPPEKLLSGKEIYPVHVNMPNLSSAMGSWILNCAQLDEGDAPYKVRGTFSGPVPVQKVDPKYPPKMINEHVDGEVVLYAIIRKDGSVDSVQLVRGLDPILDRNSMEALAQWKFRPGTRDGAPIDVETVAHIPFHFRTLQDY
jgi:TonB family protein